MKLNVSITCPRELDLKGRPDGEVSFTISNQSGGHLRVKAELVAIDPALKNCLEIVKGERNWEFADKGTHQLTVKVKAPVGATDGKAKFRLQLADQATPDEAGAEGPEILVVAGTPIVVNGGGGDNRWIWIVVAAVVLVSGVMAWLIFRNVEVPVPNVIGKSIEEAKRELEKSGLKGVNGDAVPAASGGQIAVGHVAVQDPEATTMAEKGSEVTLHPKAKGVAMPHLVGKHISTVIVLLQGFRLGRIDQIETVEGTGIMRRKMPVGTVIFQHPRSGEYVTPDVQVSLILEGKPGAVKISDFVKDLKTTRFTEGTRGIKVLRDPMLQPSPR